MSSDLTSKERTRLTDLECDMAPRGQDNEQRLAGAGGLLSAEGCSDE